MKERNFKENKGITLIALIITIIVILILVAVSVRTISKSGLFDHAKDATRQWAEKQKEESEINIDDLIKDNVPEVIPDGIYSVPGVEDKIAPTDLFDYEIIEEAGNDTGIDGLPIKVARITRIKPQYCNYTGYNPDTNEQDLEDTNYEIIYKGERISDILVIPYQVEIDGEMYKITEVNLAIAGTSDWGNVQYSLPSVDAIIYPNTIEKIKCDNLHFGSLRLKEVVLSNNLKEIPEHAFYYCNSLTNITIPSSVTSIGRFAFSSCNSLTNINIKAPEGSIPGAPWGAKNATITWDYQGE